MMQFREEDFAHLLENLMVNNTDVIYFKDRQSRFIKVNEACAHKHGWDNTEYAVGKTDFDVFADEHAQRAYDQEQRIIRTGEPWIAIEEREVWPDGHITWVSSTKMPLRDPDGTIIGIFGVTRDITNRKEADLKVTKYAEQIKAIKEEMENDIRMAGKLQKGFFSARYPEFEGANGNNCISFLHRFSLNRQVTGDYCAVSRVSDTEAGIFLCDISGVGIRAALCTALIRGMIQDLSACADDPGKFLHRMNELLLPLLKVNGEALAAAASYMVVDLTTGVVRMAHAGPVMPIYFHQEFSAAWLSEEEDSGGPLLALQADARYPVVTRTLEPGDSVIAFTDGLFTVKNSMDDQYGCKRLLDSAHSWAGEPLADIFDGLENDARAFSRTRKFVDDVCLVGFTLNQLMDG